MFKEEKKQTKYNRGRCSLNKKAFTLIELMGVIMLLAIISLITLTVVNRSVRKADGTLYNVQISNIISGAKNMGAYYIKSLPKEGKIYVLLGQLIQGGYVEDKIKSPVNDKMCFPNDLEVEITVKASGGYEYNVDTDDITFVDCEDDQELVIPSATLKESIYFNEGDDIPFLEDGSGIPRSKYESVTTVSTNKVPSNAIYSWDVSAEQNGGIMAWYLDADNNGMYELYIGQKSYVGQEYGVKANPNSLFLFYCFSNLISIDVSNLNTSNVDSMIGMFSGNIQLTRLDLSSFDTSNVTSMMGMFAGDSQLTSLDLSNFDTSNVTDMYSMFNNNSSLTNLDLSSFDTSNVTSVGLMFNETSGLQTLKMNKANFDKVNHTYDMFNGSKVSTIYVKNDAAKNFINSRLSEVGITSNVLIAP